MFEIKKINISKYNIKIKFCDIIYKLESAQLYNDEVRILTTTSNDNYVINSKIIDNIYNISKKDIKISNQINLIGMFPIDFNFGIYDINVLFSADSIVGDIEKGLLQYERKEKLKKLNNI